MFVDNDYFFFSNGLEAYAGHIDVSRHGRDQVAFVLTVKTPLGVVRHTSPGVTPASSEEPG